MSEFSTPLMRQYNGIKERYPNALLLFRLGDFYELFFEDAIVASKELQIRHRKFCSRGMKLNSVYVNSLPKSPKTITAEFRIWWEY